MAEPQDALGRCHAEFQRLERRASLGEYFNTVLSGITGHVAEELVIAGAAAGAIAGAPIFLIGVAVTYGAYQLNQRLGQEIDDQHDKAVRNLIRDAASDWIRSHPGTGMSVDQAAEEVRKSCELPNEYREDIKEQVERALRNKPPLALGPKEPTSRGSANVAGIAKISKAARNLAPRSPTSPGGPSTPAPAPAVRNAHGKLQFIDRASMEPVVRQITQDLEVVGVLLDAAGPVVPPPLSKLVKGAITLGTAYLTWEKDPAGALRGLLSVAGLFRRQGDPVLGALGRLSAQIESLRKEVLEALHRSTQDILRAIQEESQFLKDMLTVIDGRIAADLFEHINLFEQRIKTHVEEHPGLVSADGRFVTRKQAQEFWTNVSFDRIRDARDRIRVALEVELKAYVGAEAGQQTKFQDAVAWLLLRTTVPPEAADTKFARLCVVQEDFVVRRVRPAPTEDLAAEVRADSARLKALWGGSTPLLLDHKRVLQLGRLTLTLAPLRELDGAPGTGVPWTDLAYKDLARMLALTQACLSQQALWCGNFVVPTIVASLREGGSQHEGIRKVIEHPYLAMNASLGYVLSCLEAKGWDALGYQWALHGRGLGLLPGLLKGESCQVTYLSRSDGAEEPYLSFDGIHVKLPSAELVAQARMQYPPWVRSLMALRTDLLEQMALIITRSDPLFATSEVLAGDAAVPRIAILDPPAEGDWAALRSG